MGLLRSYKDRRNQKTENNTRKTPDLKAQKLADKMKKTKKKLQKQKKPPTNISYSSVITHYFVFLNNLRCYVECSFVHNNRINSFNKPSFVKQQ